MAAILVDHHPDVAAFHHARRAVPRGIENFKDVRHGEPASPAAAPVRPPRSPQSPSSCGSLRGTGAPARPRPEPMAIVALCVVASTASRQHLCERPRTGWKNRMIRPRTYRDVLAQSGSSGDPARSARKSGPMLPRRASVFLAARVGLPPKPSAALRSGCQRISCQGRAPSSGGPGAPTSTDWGPKNLAGGGPLRGDHASAAAPPTLKPPRRGARKAKRPEHAATGAAKRREPNGATGGYVAAAAFRCAAALWVPWGSDCGRGLPVACRTGVPTEVLPSG